MSVMSTEKDCVVEELTLDEKVDQLREHMGILRMQMAEILGIIDQGKQAVEGMSANPMARMMLKNLGLG